MSITIEEVCAYREIYYEHVKPALKAGRSQEQIKAMVEYIAPEYGLTEPRFAELMILDLCQRLAEMKSDKISISDGSTELNSKQLSPLLNAPLLRCPRRTEQFSPGFFPV